MPRLMLVIIRLPDYAAEAEARRGAGATRVPPVF